MLDLIGSVLGDKGWTAQGVTGAKQAFAVIDAASAPPAVLICDVLMPGLDGLELTRRLLGRIPTLKAILISGHLTDFSWWPSDLRDHRFLMKPFSNSQLVSAVKEALGEFDSGV